MIADSVLLDWMKADAADTATLRLLEQAAIKVIQKQTGRYWGATSTITEIKNFKSWPLCLANEPTGGVITSLEQWNGSAYAVVTSTNYYVDGAFIWPNATYTWPPSYLYPLVQMRFRVIYQAGFTVGGDPNVWPAPDDIQMAVKLLVGHWYENRESVVIGTTSSEVQLSLDYILSGETRVVV